MNKLNWQDIQKFYDNNHTWRDIVKKYNITYYIIIKAQKLGKFKTRNKSDAGIISNKKFPRKVSEETKQKISKGRIKYLKENPDKVPYLLNHYSKGESYPEKYFNEIFIKSNIKYKRYYRINRYELDFVIIEKLIDIEIDGEQHYLDERIIKSDKRRNIYLENLGWTIIRIRWSNYKKLNKNERICYIKDLLSYINGLIKLKPEIKIKEEKNNKKDYCKCGIEKYKKAKHCIKCSSIKKRKVERPSYKQLLKEIEKYSYLAIGRKYNVSDNTIRKWKKTYELELDDKGSNVV